MPCRLEHEIRSPAGADDRAAELPPTAVQCRCDESSEDHTPMTEIGGAPTARPNVVDSGAAVAVSQRDEHLPAWSTRATPTTRPHSSAANRNPSVPQRLHQRAERLRVARCRRSEVPARRSREEEAFQLLVE
jgi:hypothetical protein